MLFIIIYLLSISLITISSLQSIIEWKYLNYTSIPSSILYDPKIISLPSSIKISKNNEYIISIPRYMKDGNFIPATLAKIRLNNYNINNKTLIFNPLIDAFPNWEWNDINSNKHFSSIKGIEIDAYNRLWVLDQGIINNKYDQQMKILAFNLSDVSYPLIHEYIFTEDIYSIDKPLPFLNELVIDLYNNFLYISDSGTLDFESNHRLNGSLIVYDISNKIAHKILNSTSIVNAEVNDPFKINGDQVFKSHSITLGISGLALCGPQSDFLYFQTVSNLNLYYISTQYLRDTSLSNERLIQLIGSVSKATNGDGITCSDTSMMYIGGLGTNSILSIQVQYDGKPEFANTIATSTSMVWPSNFGFDHTGYLVFISNSFNRYYENRLSVNGVNFIIWAIKVGQDSYAFKIPSVAPIPTQDPDTLSREALVENTAFSMAALVGLSIAIFISIKLRRKLCPKKKRNIDFINVTDTPINPKYGNL